jgi:hypothetical protein
VGSVKSGMVTLSTTEIAILVTIPSALIAALVSIFTTRYTVKHGTNYAGQIETLNQALASLAATQEEMKQHYAHSLVAEKERHDLNERRTKAAQWKPRAEIIAVNEGQQHVNKLSINSIEKFVPREVFLLSDSGARVYKFPQTWLEPVVGQNIPIPHNALNELASKSESYGLYGWFDGAIQFTVDRLDDDSVPCTGEVRFRATSYELGNTRWFHLAG